jgi:hypothetical protein
MISAIASGIAYHDFKTYYAKDKTVNQTYVNFGIYFSIIMVSICTFFHIILTIMRYKIIIKVKKFSMEISKIGKLFFIVETIYSTGNFKYMIAEIFIALIHPNIGFHCIIQLMKLFTTQLISVDIS